MDTSDPKIVFDAKGVCNHCHAFDAEALPVIQRAKSAEGVKHLETLVKSIKERSGGGEYDCIIGISGGVDSTYVAWKVKELGLRPLAVHFDSGWNSELAVSNIENVVKRLDIDLYTFVVDWEEMADLQRSFFRAGLANCDIPTDHGFLAVLYRMAVKHGIKTFISGGNVATEFILPSAWGYNAGDLTHLRAVHKRFGTVALRQYPTLGFFGRYFWYPFVRRVKEVRILNYMPYDKNEAKALISRELGWRDYGGKHYESVFTRFFQAYYLPRKFGFDKRLAHYSSLIVSGQMSREAALEAMTQPAAPAIMLETDKEFVCKKIGLPLEEFEALMVAPPHIYSEFASDEWKFKLKTWMMQIIR